MIYVTRLNHTSVVLNSDLIEHIEATPDTVITMTTGQRITVLESPADVVSAVRAWRHSLLIADELAAPQPHELECEDMQLPSPGLTSPIRALDHHHG